MWKVCWQPVLFLLTNPLGSSILSSLGSEKAPLGFRLNVVHGGVVGFILGSQSEGSEPSSSNPTVWFSRRLQRPKTE